MPHSGMLTISVRLKGRGNTESGLFLTYNFLRYSLNSFIKRYGKAMNNANKIKERRIR